LTFSWSALHGPPRGKASGKGDQSTNRWPFAALDAQMAEFP